MTLAAGTDSVTVTATDDLYKESAEDLTATITGVTDGGDDYEVVKVGTLANGYTSDANAATTTITDDADEGNDTVYAVISVDEAAIEEGEDAVFTIKLVDSAGNTVTAPADADITVNLSWAGDVELGDGSDVTPYPLPSSVTLAAGTDSVTVTATDDLYKESAEDLTATITGVTDGGD
ncbi:MAG: hypothetical protein GY754_21370, partial [bacterium]|nr:hypothetical protein [bacterium]